MTRASAVQIVAGIAAVSTGLYLAFGPWAALVGGGFLLLADAYMPDGTRRE